MKEVNKQSSPTGISRREFLGMAATGAAALTILPSFTVAGLGHVAPSDKLYIAKIGCGGMGAADLGSLMNTPHKNAAITCLCDVDDRQSVDARKTYPKAKYFNDFREMYEKEGKNFDAVCISTPDHNHAIQAFGAMRMGKHVYLQKPIAHDIYEAHEPYSNRTLKSSFPVSLFGTQCYVPSSPRPSGYYLPPSFSGKSKPLAPDSQCRCEPAYRPGIS